MHGLLESVKQLNFDMGVKEEVAADGTKATSMNIVDDSGEVKWFNMVLYNPLHIVNNVSVGYEMCDVYTQFERLSGLFSMDWSLLGSYVSTDLVYFLTPEGADKLKEITDLVGCDGLSEAVGGIAKTVDAATKVVDGAPTEKPKDQAGWEGAAKTAEDATKVVEDASKALENLDLSKCEPNFFKMGKAIGSMLSRVMQQKLDESKLP